MTPPGSEGGGGKRNMTTDDEGKQEKHGRGQGNNEEESPLRAPPYARPPNMNVAILDSPQALILQNWSEQRSNHETMRGEMCHLQQEAEQT